VFWFVLFGFDLFVLFCFCFCFVFFCFCIHTHTHAHTHTHTHAHTHTHNPFTLHQSMVGYILGLGDRHPSNMMMERSTGMIIHVDLGDCFEVAMKRERSPEKVPFRLTRMFVEAMEVIAITSTCTMSHVSLVVLFFCWPLFLVLLVYDMKVTGVEGRFRMTSNRVMSLLRNNADSVIAVLEAFVHDPLINWFDKKYKPGKRTRNTTTQMLWVLLCIDTASSFDQISHFLFLISTHPIFYTSNFTHILFYTHTHIYIYIYIHTHTHTPLVETHANAMSMSAMSAAYEGCVMDSYISTQR